MELSNKPWLDQTGNHYKIVITMVISTWNEHLDIQVNKVYASRNKILQGHKSENT